MVEAVLNAFGGEEKMKLWTTTDTTFVVGVLLANVAVWTEQGILHPEFGAYMTKLIREWGEQVIEDGLVDENGVFIDEWPLNFDDPDVAPAKGEKETADYSLPVYPLNWKVPTMMTTAVKLAGTTDVTAEMHTGAVRPNGNGGYIITRQGIELEAPPAADEDKVFLLEACGVFSGQRFRDGENVFWTHEFGDFFSQMCRMGAVAGLRQAGQAVMTGLLTKLAMLLLAGPLGIGAVGAGVIGAITGYAITGSLGLLHRRVADRGAYAASQMGQRGIRRAAAAGGHNAYWRTGRIFSHRSALTQAMENDTGSLQIQFGGQAYTTMQPGQTNQMILSNESVDYLCDNQTRLGIAGVSIVTVAATMFQWKLRYQPARCRYYKLRFDDARPVNDNPGDPLAEVQLLQNDTAAAYNLQPYTWRLRKRIELLQRCQNVTNPQGNPDPLPTATLTRLKRMIDKRTGPLYLAWKDALNNYDDANPCDAAEGAITLAVRNIRDQVQDVLEAAPFQADGKWLTYATEFQQLYDKISAFLRANNPGHNVLNGFYEDPLWEADEENGSIQLTKVLEVAYHNSTNRDALFEITEQGNRGALAIMRLLEDHHAYVTQPPPPPLQPDVAALAGQDRPKAWMAEAAQELRRLRQALQLNIAPLQAQPQAGQAAPVVQAPQPAQAQASIVDEVFARMRVS